MAKTKEREVPSPFEVEEDAVAAIAREVARAGPFVKVRPPVVRG